MYGIVANVVSDRILRTGAKVWLIHCNGDASNPWVCGLSKGGRPIRKYTKFKRLTNFRVAWVPEHLHDEIVWAWEDKDAVEAKAHDLADMWDGVRFFSSDGTEIRRDGISEGEVFRRAVASNR